MSAGDERKGRTLLSDDASRQMLATLGQWTAGMSPQAIHGGGLCTISDPARFYSHRRDQRTGRMATLVWRDR